MDSFTKLFAKDADIKDVDRVTSQVKLVNALGQTLAVIGAISLAAWKLSKEMKKD